MANVCLSELGAWKLTRTGDRCQTGAEQAESGAASSGKAPEIAFFNTGFLRFNSATIADRLLPSSEIPQ
jgi:hypothetical protein